MSNCPHCDGTGWMRVAIYKSAGGEELSAVKPCVCRVMKAESGFEPAGGIAPQAVAELRKDPAVALNETEMKISEMIEGRRGRENAITIGEIAGALWPEDAANPHALPKLQRAIKQSVERLRSVARMPIASTKAPPYGYYIPVTAEECDECHYRLLREGVKLIRLSQIFNPDADIVAELRGQLRMGGGRSE